MTLTIGRFTEPRGPQYVDRESGQLEFGLLITPSSLNEARALRHQLLGLVDEVQAVPITFFDDSDGWDGFYIISDVQVEDTQAWFTNNGVMRARVRAVSATRQPAGAVLFEVSQTGGLRPNVEGVTTSDIAHRVVVPSQAEQTISSRYGQAAFALSTTTILTASGAVEQINNPPTFMTTDYDVIYSIEADQFYNGSASIEFSIDGSNWYGLHGTRIPRGTLGVRLTNGLLRVSQLDVGASDFRTRFERWDGSAWDQVIDVEMGVYRNSSGSSRNQISQNWRALRNTVESAAVRVLVDNGDYVDISLDRGHYHAECAAGELAKTVGSQGFEVLLPSSGAATAITGGIRKTTFTASGWKWVVVAPDFNSTSLTSPAYIAKTGGSSSGYADTFAIGITDTAAGDDIISDYFAATATVQKVVR